MYLNSARGPLFSIVGSYWGALVCACQEQEALLHSPRCRMLSLVRDESWDRVSGKVDTMCEPWMMRQGVQHRHIVLQVTAPCQGPVASWPVPAGQGVETTFSSPLATRHRRQ